MSRIAVIYKSKYGATKKYATWISESLNADLYDKLNLEKLKEYDTLIYGGGLYAGGINGIASLVNNYNRLINKKIIVFTCGLANPEDTDNIKSIHKSINENIPVSIRESITFFHFRGSINYKNLTVVHKVMMTTLIKILKKKDFNTLRNEDKEMLSTYGQVIDFTNKDSIIPLIDFVKN